MQNSLLFNYLHLFFKGFILLLCNLNHIIIINHIKNMYTT